MKTCPICGAPVADSIDTCFKCGSPMEEGDEAPSLMERFIDEPTVHAVKPGRKKPAHGRAARGKGKVKRKPKAKVLSKPSPESPPKPSPKAPPKPSPPPSPQPPKPKTAGLQRVVGGNEEIQMAARIYGELVRSGVVGSEKRDEAEALLGQLGAELPEIEPPPKKKAPRKAPKLSTRPPPQGDELPEEPPSPSDLVACPGCDKPVEAGWSHCPFCGHALGGCSGCGAPMEPGWTFCPQCGHKA